MWKKGLTDWTQGNTAYISVVFSWNLQAAYQRAIWYRALGYRVRAGGGWGRVLDIIAHLVYNRGGKAGVYRPARTRYTRAFTLESAQYGEYWTGSRGACPDRTVCVLTTKRG